MINKIIVKTLPIVPKPIVHLFAKKYIAGPTLADAVRVTEDLMNEGGMSTIDVLGEFVETKARATHEKNESLKVLEAIRSNNLQSYLSVKPTSVGLGIDWDFAHSNIKELVTAARDKSLRMRIDMENSPYIDTTLKMYKTLRDEGFDNVGFVIQAYMKRSEDDVRSFASYKPNVRLCKGIYNESAKIAYKDFKEVQENYKRLLKYMLENEFYVGIATHDDDLLDYGLEMVNKMQLPKDAYEFQMLLGVKEKRRKEIINAGHPLRVYVPFGEDWYGYSVRRLKENPKMAGHIVKSIFGIN